MEWRYHDDRRDLVAQGDTAGYFNVYRADNGKKLWSLFAQSGIIGAPSTYTVGGEQYVASDAGANKRSA
jgi:glucose dehydrogenase